MGLFNEQGFSAWFWQARLLIDLLAVAWLVGVVNFAVLPNVISAIGGLRPRTLQGIPGIVLSPFIHSSWQHLSNNSTAYLIFGGMIMLRDSRDFVPVTVAVTLISGGLTWIFGRIRTRYVGASDTIFGYIGFLLALALVYRDPTSTIFFVVFILSFLFGERMVFPALTGNYEWRFGKALWGMLPQQDGRIAWETHLIGFLAGIWTAYHLEDLRELIDPIGDWVRGTIAG